jgi:hypothetical protein
MALIKQFPVCPVTNGYSIRSRVSFVPFVYSADIPQSLIVCDTRHMSVYQQIAGGLGLSALFITSPKQMKQTTLQAITQC